ncbi:putative metal-dependent hydrolase [Paenibacillus antri]|uniref:Putative metal-dependent hydrolase FE782_29420 n=1 Tax=Paenibacillus antri TaxID=2582848 RepID=A0A5R9G2Y7_9BACL|nr:bacillithiol transferase BstA [Paenibacillus antri]TLS48656.1 putative metal-dependent hydrolase [Paenibacillus antri]
MQEHAEHSRYPIGTYERREVVAPAEREAWIEDIAALPERLREAVRGLTPERLDTPYRPGGWTVRQVVHHVADSHMNSFVRLKLALTEDAPTIKPYREDLWAELDDARAMDVEPSLQLLTALHARWTTLLRGFGEDAWARTFLHPESGATDLANHAGLYAWHGNHHVAHITNLRRARNW